MPSIVCGCQLEPNVIIAPCGSLGSAQFERRALTQYHSSVVSSHGLHELTSSLQKTGYNILGLDMVLPHSRLA